MSRGLLSPKSLAIIGCTLLVIAAVVAASLWDDHRADRKRPMFRSIIKMEQLQYQLLKADKEPVLVRLRPSSDPVVINGVSYKPEKHVTIVVAERDGKTCVRGSNQFDDSTEWICIDPTLGPPKMGALQ